jgi:predicted phosphodiesterase
MSRWKKFLVASDVHGDHQDKKACAVFFKFADLWKPDIRVMAGDLWDFRPLRKKACEEERRESMVKDFQAGLTWLRRFRPNIFLRGNHDERLYDLAEADNGVLSDYAIQGTGEIRRELDRLKCRMLPYDKRNGVLRLGHLKIIHGYASGVNASRSHANVYGSCLFGHTHAIDESAIPGLDRRVARNIGCLCALDMVYNRAQLTTLKQAHGFAYGISDSRTGEFRVWQAEEISGKWVLPTDIAAL